ncbi:MAG TPA: hypothetical protein VJ400_01415 [Thermoplasmata archaeon]|nr:hypothetical protein [Thermoplasmata archaeon]
MANLTLRVPDSLYEELRRHPEIRWSEVARQALVRKLEDLRRLDELLAGSTLGRRDVEAVSGRVKKAVWTRHRKPSSRATR